MNGLFLHTSNRLETLAAELARVVSVPLESPFTPEIVMVQSLGMRRWISLHLADQLGICMNSEFPFPRTFLDETLRRLVPEMASPDSFSVESMTWRIHSLLPALLERAEFAPVRRYTADGDAMKLYQLACRLAQLFDQYLVYRPEMMLAWEEDAWNPPPGSSAEFVKTAAWQALLWRELNCERLCHFASALRQIAAGIPNDAELPSRFSIFGIASLPPAQMEVFFHLAACRPVHLFLLAPSREYHGDDLTPRERARRGLSPSTEGNPLLTSLGKLNAQFTNVLLETDERAGHRIVNFPEIFSDPGTDTLLHTLQHDILSARNRAQSSVDGTEDELDKFAMAAGDRSLQVHVCHSPMREVEVLYDQLLDLFANDRSLRPRDIVVMTPDIESYAPLIHAVFGCPEDPVLRIPFSIADRQPRSDSPIIGTFLSILELPGTRCTAPQIFALLQSPPFRRKYRFDDEELGRIREWIHESGIRWGMDAAHRSELGIPEFTENTWKHGMDRLLLGYAMTGGSRTTFDGILPVDDVEGSGAELVGRLLSALEALFTVATALGQSRKLGEWPLALENLIDQFFTDDPNAAPLDRHDVSDLTSQEVRDVRNLRETVERFRRIALESGPEQPVEFAAIREHISDLLGEAEQRGGFLTGGVTFCALKPMRSIPARVIWLMGMNDNAFPRRPQPPQFDLMSAQPKLGDRSVRDDDRYLFLEALLSARDRLSISHVGRSLVDHEEVPPSVVVSELLDYLDQSCVFAGVGDGNNGRNGNNERNGRQTARQWLVHEHRLHPFSSVYFEQEGSLFSYSAANCAAAQQLSGQSVTRLEPAFLYQPLADVEPEARNVELSRLVSFFDNPAAFFLKERLGIRLSRREGTLEESEPLELDALGRYSVCKELLELMVAQGSIPDESVFTARALLPSGSVGAQHFGAFQRSMKTLHGTMLDLLGTTVRDEPEPVDLRLGDFALSGRIDAAYRGMLAFFRPASLKAKDRTRAWIPHLVWCATRTEAPPSLLVGNDEKLQLESLSEGEAREQLLALLEIYWQGMKKPLPFFPETSFVFVDSQRLNGRRSPLERAQEKWRGSRYITGEKDDPACRICFGESDPLDAEFESLANAIFGSMQISELLQPRTKA